MRSGRDSTDQAPINDLAAPAMPRHVYATEILHQLHRRLVLTDRPWKMMANAAVQESALTQPGPAFAPLSGA
jgi:hypothetical protein